MRLVRSICSWKCLCCSTESEVLVLEKYFLNLLASSFWWAKLPMRLIDFVLVLMQAFSSFIFSIAKIVIRSFKRMLQVSQQAFLSTLSRGIDNTLVIGKIIEFPYKDSCSGQICLLSIDFPNLYRLFKFINWTMSSEGDRKLEISFVSFYFLFECHRISRRRGWGSDGICFLIWTAFLVQKYIYLVYLTG